MKKTTQTPLKIAKSDNSILRSKLREDANWKDASLKRLIEDMIFTMRNSEPKGIGLAAPQVFINQRLFIWGPIHDKNDPKKIIVPLTVVLNPKIVWKSKKYSQNWEGCLSIPNRWGQVKRPKAISVTYTNIYGKFIEEDFNGFPAIVFQHEFDHIEGILFTDRIKDKNSILTTEAYNKMSEARGIKDLEI